MVQSMGLVDRSFLDAMVGSLIRFKRIYYLHSPPGRSGCRPFAVD